MLTAADCLEARDPLGLDERARQSFLFGNARLVFELEEGGRGKA